MTTAVVGGGVTGLATAQRLLRERSDLDVVVLEADTRPGGKIATSAFAGHPVDCGADAFLARVPEAVELCHELGLERDLVTPAVRNAYVFVDGCLQPFPDGLVLGVPTDIDALRRSGVVSAEGVERAALDLTMGGEPLTGDESVGSLVRRRVGDEVFEKLVAPLLSGVNAGNADELSVRSGAPQFAAAMSEQPSLIEGLRRQRAAADPDAPIFFGLRSGTQSLTDALAADITTRGGVVRSGVAVTGLATHPRGYRLQTDGLGDLEFDAVALATPDMVTARLLDTVAPGVSSEMTEVEYASVVMIALAFDRRAVARPLDGSGFLVAEGEGLLMTACSWASSKWNHLASDDQVVLRVSAGRHHDQRALHLDDDELVDAIVADLRTTMDAEGVPIAVRVTRWVDALPQFRPGHLDRVARWRTELGARTPGLAVGGAGFDGLGVPACIRQGWQMAATLLGSMGR